MTRGSDDLTLTFYETKQNVTMTKTIDDNNIKQSLDTENEILNPIWLLGQTNTRLTLYLGAESKYS